jgi:hypothetical protein
MSEKKGTVDNAPAFCDGSEKCEIQPVLEKTDTLESLISVGGLKLVDIAVRFIKQYKAVKCPFCGQSEVDIVSVNDFNSPETLGFLCKSEKCKKLTFPVAFCVRQFGKFMYNYLKFEAK